METESTLSPTGNVRLDFFSPSRLSSDPTVEEVRDMEPDHTEKTHNVHTQSYRENFVDLIHPEKSGFEIEATHIAFGDDNTAESLTDDGIKSEVYRRQVDFEDSDGTKYWTITLIDADEANSLNLTEWSLVDDTKGLFINRAVVDDPKVKPKTDEWAIAARIEINFLDISEV